MKTFEEWLVEHATRPGAKQGLYPLGYGGIGLYPPSDMMNWAADALVYMPVKDRVLKFIWGQGILARPKHVEPD
jgi:hypothetical protein